VVERTIPSRASSSTNARSITASSSLVSRGSVATRNCSVSRSPSNRPKTVCVLPTSIARSSGSEVVAERAVAVAHALRERVRGELRLLALGAQLLDRDVGRGVDLDARHHPRRPVLVPDPDVLHLDLEERVGRLRHVLEVELVAQVRRLLGEHAVPEQAVDRAVLLLDAQLELGLEVVQLVEMAHDDDSSPASSTETKPRPGTTRAGSSSTSGSRANLRSCRRGCGTVRPGSSSRWSPYRSRSRSIARGPQRGPSRVRPSARSTSSRRSRSARGPRSVSSSAAALRK